MADQMDSGLDAPSPEKNEILPSSMVPGRAVNSVVLRAGLGKPSLPNRAMDPMALLKSFRRRWALATGLGIVLATIVGVTAFMVVPQAKYSTEAILRISTFQPKIIFNIQEQAADYEVFKRTQMQLIKGPVVLDPVLRDPKVASLPIVRAEADPLEWLKSQIQVSFLNGSEILAIGMTGAVPDQLKPIVDSVVSSYMTTVVEDEHKNRVRRLEDLRKLYTGYQDDHKNRRASIRELSGTAGSSDRMTLVMKQGFQLENLQSLQKELMNIQAQLRTFNSYASVIETNQKEQGGAIAVAPGSKAAVSKPGPLTPLEWQQVELARNAEIEARIASHPQVAELAAELDEHDSKIYKLRRLARDPNDPALHAVRIQRAEAEVKHKKLREQLRSDLLALIARGGAEGKPPGEATSPNGQPTRTNLEVLRDRIVILERQKADLTKEIERWTSEISKFSTQTVDLTVEQEEISIAGETARKIGKEIEGLEVELQAPRRITELAAAGMPRQKDGSKRILLCGGASFGAFALAVLAVTFLELRTMRIDSVSEVVTDLGIPLVGALPALPGRGGKVSKAEDQRWQGLLVESIDATRTMLLHAARVNSTRAVLITSAMKGEGKTSLAAHLATSLARAGRKTLLIDCDLRRPTLHQLFDVPRVPGLCELLRGEAELNDAIRPTPADDLNLMPAGLCDGLALQAIAQDGVRDILAGLKKRYDFIIIDSAPVLPVVDTMLISQQVDAVLFSVMREVSRVPLVQAAHERLATLGVKLLGAVVSGAQKKDYMHSYDYEYQTADTSSV